MINQLFLTIVWDVDPFIFSDFPHFRWYSVCWGLGLFLGHQVLQHIYRRDQKSEQDLHTLSIYLILGIIIGARLGHVVFYEPIYYWNHPIEILPIRTDPHFQFTGFHGLASHGGVLGALSGIGLFSRKYGESVLWILDRLIIVGALVGAFIRIGNLLNSEIIGTVTDVPWAFVFKMVDPLPRHPSQVYEVAAYLVAFALLFSIWMVKKLKQNGGLFGLGLCLIFSLRFALEFFKIDQVAFEHEMVLNMGQLLSIPLILIGLSILIKKRTVNERLCR